VEELVRALEREDAGFMARWIAEAAGHRRRLLEAAYPAQPEELYRVRVHVPDRPGVLSGITQALGAHGINIEDFELHHMSADRGGTVVVTIAGEAEAQRAVALLDEQGYGAIAAPAVDEGGGGDAGGAGRVAGRGADRAGRQIDQPSRRDGRVAVRRA